MVVRLIAAVVSLGGTVSIDEDRLVCRLPAGVQLPADLARELKDRKAEIISAISTWDLNGTVENALALSAEERIQWADIVAHDLAAYSQFAARVREERR